MDNKEKFNLSQLLNSQQFRVLLAILSFLVIMYFWGSYANVEGPTYYRISYTQFMQLLRANRIHSVTIQDLNLHGELIEAQTLMLSENGPPTEVKFFKTQLPSFQGEELLAELEKYNVNINIKEPEQISLVWRFLLGMLPWILLIGIWIYIVRRSQSMQGGGGAGPFSFGKSKAKLFDAHKPGVRFDDIAGMEHAKQDLKEIIDFLRNPEQFHQMGAKVPKGVLLFGPPGTGKTLLARATAGEAAVPFYNISASEFIEMFVGVGASRVRDMFNKAKQNHPSIIFIDELDAVGRTRGAGLGGGHDEREQTLNQLLSEMDGFSPQEEVIVIAATNRPDVLDPALLRPGRFDRHVIIDKPSLKEREYILKVHVRNKKLDKDVNLFALAQGTPGMSGADLENLANEASLTAVRKKKSTINMQDFEEARDKILMGSPREEIISELEKQITAYHESGHTLVAWELPGTDPLHKVSIIPRGMAMGVTQLLPEEDRHYYPRSYLISRLCVALGGRVAEKIVFQELSSGAQNDLKEATSLAEKMVAQWGMSDVVGPVSLSRGEEHPFLGKELASPKHYSEDMAWLMDQEIRKLILEAEQRTIQILTDKRHVLDALAKALLREEILDREQVKRIIEQVQPTLPALRGSHLPDLPDNKK